MAAGERSIRIKIDGDSKGLIVSVRTADKEIERLGKRVDDANNRFARAAKTFVKFALAASALSSSTGGLVSLGTTLTTASGALIALPAYAAAAGAAMGTIALGADGVTEAFSGVNESLVPLKGAVSGAFDRGLQPAVANINRILPKTASGFSQLAVQLSGVASAATATAALPANVEQLNGFLDQTSGLMSGVRRAAGPLTQALLDVVSVGSAGFDTVGDKIASAAGRFAGFIAQAKASGQLRAFIDNGVAALKQLFQTLKDIGAIVTGVFSGISEGAGGLPSTFGPAIKSMREFVESTGGQDFLRKVGAALAEIGEAVGGVLSSGLHAVAPLVGPLATSLATLATTASSILVPTFTILAPILQVIADAMEANSGAVRVLVTVLGGLAIAYLSVRGAINLVKGATELWTTVSDVAATKAAGLGTSFSSMGKVARIASLSLGAIGVIASVVGTALAVFGGQSAEAKQEQQQFAAASKSVAKVLKEENDQLNQKTRAAAASALEERNLLKRTDDLGLSTRDLTDAYLGNNDARIRLNRAIQGRIDLLQEEGVAAEQAGDTRRAADIREEINQLGQLKTETDNAIGTREQESDAIDRQAKATGQATENTKQSAAAMRSSTQALLDNLDALTEQANLLLGARGAERDYFAAVDAANKAIQENGATLDATTEKGRNNGDALDAIAQSTINLTAKMKENGATAADLQAVTARGGQQFVDTAKKMGATAEEAVNLAIQYGLVPRTVATYINLLGVDYATARALAFKNFIASIPSDKVVNLRVSAQGNGHYLPGMATGGPLTGGRDILVGETGPEILRLPSGLVGGRIFSNNQSQNLLGGGDVTVFVTIDGQQLQGRIDRTVRENNRSLKRGALAGVGGAR